MPTVAKCSDFKCRIVVKTWPLEGKDSKHEVSWHREFLRSLRGENDLGSIRVPVSVIRSLEPIQHMPPQRVPFRQEGMIEVIGRIAHHAQFFHHPA